MMNEPTRSFPADPHRPADAPTHTHTPAEPPADGATADFDPSATPAHLAGFAARLGALAGPDSTRDAAPHTTPAAVPQVPGYELLDELGRGGMGVVYKARELKLNRTVALKMVLAGPYADPATRVRFLLEAESVAAVQHPHIVQVFAFGEHAGHPYLAMEYLGGGTLADKVRKDGPLPPLEAAKLAATLAEAMAAAHAAGIVHRDLKPANVLLSATGEPKVTDFGLAKVGRSDMTATGAVLGTPSYMAPEQAAGRAREVGTAADVYGLGAILYDVLTGRPPFRGDSQAATIQMVLSAEPTRPRSVNAVIPRDLETICLKCLEKVPVRRYPTAAALAEDLGRFLNREPVSARPVGQAGRAWRWCRRNPAVAGLLAAVLLVFAAGAGIASYFAVEESNRAKEASENARRANENAEKAAEREKEANDERNNVLAEKKKLLAEQDRTRRLLHLTRMNNASIALSEGRISRLCQLLDEAKPAPGEPDPRGWEWHYLDRLTRPETPGFNIIEPNRVGENSFDTDIGTTLVMAPDARRALLMRLSEKGVAFETWDMPAGRRVGEFRIDEYQSNRVGEFGGAPGISPDGTHVAVPVPSRPTTEHPEKGKETHYRIRVWDVATGKETAGPPGEYVSLNSQSPVVGPAAEWVAWVDDRPKNQYVAWRWDRRSGKVTRLDLVPGPAEPGVKEGRLPHWTPDGQSIGSLVTRERTKNRWETCYEVWDASADKLRLRFQSPWALSSRRPMCWSPGGKSIMTVTEDELVVRSFSDGATLWTIKIPDTIGPFRRQELDFEAVSDEGTRVVAVANGHSLLVLDRQDGTPGFRLTQFHHRNGFAECYLSSDGKSLVTLPHIGIPDERTTVLVWDLSRDPSRPVVWGSGAKPPPRVLIADPVLSPDSRLTVEYLRPDASAGVGPGGATLVRNVASAAVIGRIDPPDGRRVSADRPGSFSPDGRRLLVSFSMIDKQTGGFPMPGTTMTRRTLYDTDGVRPVASWDDAANISYEWRGPWLISSEGKRRRVRDPHTGAPGAVLEDEVFSYRSLIVDPSGQWLAVGRGVTRAAYNLPLQKDPPPGPTTPVGVKVYATKTGRAAWTRDDVGQAAVVKHRNLNGGSVPGSDDPGGEASVVYNVLVDAPLFSPDGQWVGMSYQAAPDKEARVWVGRSIDGSGERTFEVPKTLPYDGMHPSVVWTFTPDSRRLVAFGSGDIRVWDLESGKLLWGHQLVAIFPPSPNQKAFSADGRRLAVAHGPDVTVWELDTGQQVGRCHWNESQIDWVAFTPDGSQVLTTGRVTRPPGNEPPRLVVWDLVLGRELLSLSLPFPSESPSNSVRGTSMSGGRVHLRTFNELWVFDGTPVKE